MLEHVYAVIMAGGGGTRLWPVSRNNRPKQMLPLLEEHRTLFQTTVERLQGLLPAEQILVVTIADQAEALMRQAPQLPKENFLLEPAPRGTASVVGLAAIALHQRDPEAIMAVLPSDHFIRNHDLFFHLLRVAVDVARQNYLVTLGIAPTYPATGYGYIERGDILRDEYGYPVYQVARFKEKPNEIQARDMLLQGRFSWNSGMFIWRTERILDEIRLQMPDLSSTLEQIAQAWQTEEKEKVLKTLWHGLVSETIDYGIMEKAQKVAVLPASGLEWSDVGSWDSLFDVLHSDSNGNIVFAGHHKALDTENSLIYGNNDGRLIVTIGVEDMIIVDSGDVLLVCKNDQAQRVKQVVDDLKNSERTRYT